MKSSVTTILEFPGLHEEQITHSNQKNAAKRHVDYGMPSMQGKLSGRTKCFCILAVSAPPPLPVMDSSLPYFAQRSQTFKLRYWTYSRDKIVHAREIPAVEKEKTSCLKLKVGFCRGY